MTLNQETREACEIAIFDAENDRNWWTTSSVQVALDAVLATLEERGYTVAKLEQVGGITERMAHTAFATLTDIQDDERRRSARSLLAVKWEPVWRIIEEDDQ